MESNIEQSGNLLTTQSNGQDNDNESMLNEQSTINNQQMNVQLQSLDPLYKYGDFSTKHVNCMSISNPFGDVMIGDITVYGNLNTISDVELSGEKINVSCDDLTINGSRVSVLNTDIKVESSNVNLSCLNVSGLSLLNDVTINGNLIINGSAKPPKQKIEMNTFLYFGEENVEGSWRMGIVNGNMSLQKLESNMWVNKSTIQ